jgi:hypothetical protein
MPAKTWERSIARLAWPRVFPGVWKYVLGPGGDRDSQLDRPPQPVVVGVDESLDTRGPLGRDRRGRIAVDGREVGGDEEDVLLRHDLEHVVGGAVGVLDRVDSRLGGDPHRLVAGGVGGDLLLDAVGLLDDDLQLLRRQHAGAGVDDDLDAVGAVVEGLPDGASGLLDAADGHIFLRDELLGLGRQPG